MFPIYIYSGKSRQDGNVALGGSSAVVNDYSMNSPRNRKKKFLLIATGESSIESNTSDDDRSKSSPCPIIIKRPSRKRAKRSTQKRQTTIDSI